MTLIEFLHPLKSGKRRDLVLGTLYYFKRYRDRPHMTAAEIKTAMKQAKVPKAQAMNVNAVINQSAPYVHSTGAKESGSFLFEITGTGEKLIRETVGISAAEPQVEHDASALEGIAATLSDETVRGYVDEAIMCLRAGALRAAVVFLWTGAARTLQEKALAKGPTALIAAIQKHDPKSRSVRKVDDFAYVKDRTLLLACALSWGYSTKASVERSRTRSICGTVVAIRLSIGRARRRRPASSRMLSGSSGSKAPTSPQAAPWRRAVRSVPQSGSGALARPEIRRSNGCGRLRCE